MDLLLLILVSTGIVTWLSAEPDGVAAGVRGAATRAFSEGWSAGSQSAARRWQAGEADRAGRRKVRHKRWRKTRKGRALIAADRAGRATVGATVRGARLVIPATADAIGAARRAAPQGWAERREERRTRQEEKESKEKRERKAKKHRETGRAAQPETPDITTRPGAAEIDPQLIEWAKAPDPAAAGVTRPAATPDPMTPDAVRPEMTDPTAARTCWRRGCDQQAGDSGVCPEHAPVTVECPHCEKTQLVRREHADAARQAMAEGCPQRPGYNPSADTRHPAGSAKGGTPVMGEIGNHTDLQMELQNKLEALESLVADVKQMISAATEEAEATVKQAQGYAESLDGGRFGEIVHKAIGTVMEAAGAVLKQVTAMREAGDGFEKSTGELGDAIGAAEKETVAAVGA
jgi:hypothetical protein